MLRRGVRRTATGGMSATRNGGPLYVGPSNTIGTVATAGSSAGMWSWGNAVASGGLVPGIYDVCFSRYFQASDVLNFSDFSALFDIYKINKVKIKVTVSNYSQAAGVSLPGNGMLSTPSIVWYYDPDDYSLPGSPDHVRERMGIKSRQLVPGRPVTITLSPRADQVVLAGGGYAGSAVPSKPTWLDTVQNNVIHNGFKGFLKEMDLRSVSGQVPQYQVTFETKYYLSFKHVR